MRRKAPKKQRMLAVNSCIILKAFFLQEAEKRLPRLIRCDLRMSRWSCSPRAMTRRNRSISFHRAMHINYSNIWLKKCCKVNWIYIVIYDRKIYFLDVKLSDRTRLRVDSPFELGKYFSRRGFLESELALMVIRRLHFY